MRGWMRWRYGFFLMKMGELGEGGHHGQHCSSLARPDIQAISKYKNSDIQIYSHQTWETRRPWKQVTWTLPKALLVTLHQEKYAYDGGGVSTSQCPSFWLPT